MSDTNKPPSLDHDAIVELAAKQLEQYTKRNIEASEKIAEMRASGLSKKDASELLRNAALSLNSSEGHFRALMATFDVMICLLEDSAKKQSMQSQSNAQSSSVKISQSPQAPQAPPKSFASIASEKAKISSAQLSSKPVVSGKLPNSDKLVIGSWAAEAEAEAEKEVQSTGSADSDGFDFKKPSTFGFEINENSVVDITGNDAESCGECERNHVTQGGFARVDKDELSCFVQRITITETGKKITQYRTEYPLMIATCGNARVGIFFTCNNCKGERCLILFNIGDSAIILPYCINCLSENYNEKMISLAGLMTSTERDKNAFTRHISRCIENIKQKVQAHQNK